MSQNQTGLLYSQIIGAVIEGSRDKFVDEGLDTNVLNELRTLWLSKLRESGCCNHGAQGRGSAAGGRGSVDFGAVAGSSSARQVKSEAGMPAGGAPPSFAGGGVAMPQIRVKTETGVPQTDGPSDCTEEAPLGNGLFGGRKPRRGEEVELTLELPSSSSAGGIVCSRISTLESLELPSSAEAEQIADGAGAAGGVVCGGISQLDGAGGGAGGGNKRRKTDGDGGHDGGEGGGADGAGDDDDLDDEELGSDDDEEEHEPETENLIVCQYDKVTRAKAKWKAHLKHGCMLVDGLEYVFNRANGDMNFTNT
ncbi:transcription factor IIA, alpha/beta subunit-domain-containing protein [Baffinella frigidus]|nr:transcription factor IIA, alpha/beta subunit-domain-containing protein [Cryptophyta sp. CCMP2293]